MELIFVEGALEAKRADMIYVATVRMEPCRIARTTEFNHFDGISSEHPPARFLYSLFQTRRAGNK